MTMRMGPQPNEMRPVGCTTPSPSPSLDHGFESDRSSVSTSWSVSSRSDRSGSSRHTHCGQCHREPGGHMKINVPVFKDEDMKDAITYQSCYWDLMVYCQAGCQDFTLLPYVICSLQSYPGGVGKKFRDRCHFRWCTCYIGWILQQCQGP